MLSIEVYKTETNGQVLAGVIRFDGKQLIAEPTEEKYQNIVENLIEEPTLISGYPLDPQKEPEFWIKNIYKMLSTYLRCTEAETTT